MKPQRKYRPGAASNIYWDFIKPVFGVPSWRPNLHPHLPPRYQFEQQEQTIHKTLNIYLYLFSFLITNYNRNITKKKKKKKKKKTDENATKVPPWDGQKYYWAFKPVLWRSNLHHHLQPRLHNLVGYSARMEVSWLINVS